MWLVLIAVLIAATIILASIVPLGNNKDSDNPPGAFFVPGDHLTYSLSGNDNGTVLEGAEDISVELGGTSSMTNGNASTYIDVARFIRDIHDPGLWICNHVINTSWGQKTVSTYLWHHDGPNYQGESLTLTDVGIDSSTVYRTTYFTPDLYVTSVLTATNSTKIQGTDLRVDGATATGSNEVVTEPSMTNIVNGTGSGNWLLGSVNVSGGQHLKYNLTALGGYMMFFSVRDLIDTENIGQVHFVHNASLLRNQAGEVDQALTAGTYWYGMVVRNSPEGGYFDYYWR